jgi:hypothetical protein
VATSNLTDDRLRDAFAMRAKTATPAGDCPDADLVWRAVRLELPQARIRELGLHATTCAACAEAWRLAREVAAEAPADVLPFRRPSTSLTRTRGWWVGGTLAAAAALFLIVMLLPTGPGTTPPAGDTLRGAEESILPLTDLAVPLARDEATLRWEGPFDCRWEIRVATEDLHVIAEAHGLDTPEFTVPAEALAGLPVGSTIVWQVHANLPDGRRLASRSFVLQLE